MTRHVTLVVALFVAPAAAAPPGHAQHTMEGRAEGQHRTPAGWKFVLPKGEPAKGRRAFEKFECYKCHEVKGEKFPAAGDTGNVGPELATMGPLHEPEYFAEAILNASATIEKGKGYEAKDGSSKMPSFNDSMTIQELIDLVAYLKGLTPPGAPGHTH